jgi:hypothetical protein
MLKGKMAARWTRKTSRLCSRIEKGYVGVLTLRVQVKLMPYLSSQMSGKTRASENTEDEQLDRMDDDLEFDLLDSVSTCASEDVKVDTASGKDLHWSNDLLLLG